MAGGVGASGQLFADVLEFGNDGAQQIVGVVLGDVTIDDDPSRQSNAAELRRRLKPYGVRLLPEVRHGDAEFRTVTDWNSLAAAPSNPR